MTTVQKGEAATVHWATREPVEVCRRALHREPFRATHPLAAHPLFTIDALMRLAREVSKRKGDLYFDAGDVSIDDKWGKIPVPDRPVTDVIERIESAGAWIVMKHVELNPAYAAVLADWAAFVRDVAGPSGAHLLRKPEMLVFITSPNRVTPFHFDAEVNFLVQIAGSKDLWVCDPNDRTVTTEEELEVYYAGDIAAGHYKPRVDIEAQHFQLDPGDAVHIPTHGAHWVKNHDNISISLSLNFEFPAWYRADIYRANHYLRRLGVTPRGPGCSVLSDRAKAATGAAIRLTRDARRRLVSGARA
jgi:hypothetical protein